MKGIGVKAGESAPTARLSAKVKNEKKNKKKCCWMIKNVIRIKIVIQELNSDN